MLCNKLFKSKENYLSNFSQISLFLFSFILIIFPWFSRYWLTIITSTINAWNWGINYQEGYGIKSLDSWIFYFRSLPKIFGILNFSIFLFVYIFEKISQKELFKIETIKYLRKGLIYGFIYGALVGTVIGPFGAVLGV